MGARFPRFRLDPRTPGAFVETDCVGLSSARPRPSDRAEFAPRHSLAASVVVAALTWSMPARADLDVAFLLDTTGSMSGEIGEARRTVRGLAETLAAARPNERIRIGIVAYRDRSDDYLTKVSPLTEDIDVTFDFLSRLSANGGGDAPEDVLSGLDAVLTELDWSEGAERQVFLIGDAPAHTSRPVDLDMDDLIAQAVEQRVVVNAIGCRSLSSRGIEQYRRLAYATEGQYHHIGRVSTGDLGLAEAMIASLTESSDDEGPWTTVPVHQSHARSVEPSDELARRGLVVRLGEWRHAHRRADWGEQSCLLTVVVPEGLGLERTPEVASGSGGLRVDLALTEGTGGVATYELGSCFDRDTPLAIHIEEDAR